MTSAFHTLGTQFAFCLEPPANWPALFATKPLAVFLDHAATGRRVVLAHDPTDPQDGTPEIGGGVRFVKDAVWSRDVLKLAGDWHVRVAVGVPPHHEAPGWYGTLVVYKPKGGDLTDTATDPP